jgi:hypothetical protein
MEIEEIEVKDGLVYLNGVSFTVEEIQDILNQFAKSWKAALCNLIGEINKWFGEVNKAMMGTPQYHTEATLQREAPIYYLKNKYRKMTYG